MNKRKQKRIAIVGSGISGLTAARKLHDVADLTMYEAGSWIGGHTHTVDVPVDGETWAIDTGFIVFNDRTYPNFIGLMDEIGVQSQPAPMSFSVRCDQSNLEYCGSDLRGLFAQKRNLFRPSFYRLLRGILKFNKVAHQLLSDHRDQETVAEYFARTDFPQEFYDKYFLPMGSAIWSCPQSTFEAFPIRFIVEFYHHHGLLSIKDRPQWRVISGGSAQYIAPLTAPFRERIRLNCPVTAVRRKSDHVLIETKQDQAKFDHVVFACHADQALKLLAGQATEKERDVLAAFPYESNEVLLHTDESILPKRRQAWAAWNYLLPESPNEKASLTYCMNILQSLNSKHTFNVTLNNRSKIDPSKIIETFHYSHPIFDLRRTTMQQRHAELLGPNHTSYCGAYWGNGFHEDGVVSGLAVANQLRTQLLAQQQESAASDGSTPQPNAATR